MAYFYKDGKLKLGPTENDKSFMIDIHELAERHPGPVYIYDLDSIQLRFEALDQALAGSQHSIHFAMKSNSHPEILKRLASLGAGVDTVSGGEIRLALAAGVSPRKVIFSGVAKTVSEIEYALGNEIKQINVESVQELERIAQIAERMGKTADVAFRLNPDVNPKTHPYITTGFRENKFGIVEDAIPDLLAILARSKKSLRLRGLTMHIGSQLFDLAVIQEAIEKTIVVHRSLLAKGFALDRIDIGGGLGVVYESDNETSEFEAIRAYGKMATQVTKGLGVEILTEPGRILVARSGILVTRIQYIKKTPAKTFAIVDTGMHHLLRPALYGAKHRILPLSLKAGPKQNYDVAGPICESSDFIGKNIELPELTQGDMLAIADTGAYGFVMASHYNAHELPAEIVLSRLDQRQDSRNSFVIP